MGRRASVERGGAPASAGAEADAAQQQTGKKEQAGAAQAKAAQPRKAPVKPKTTKAGAVKSPARKNPTLKEEATTAAPALPEPAANVEAAETAETGETAGAAAGAAEIAQTPAAPPQPVRLWTARVRTAFLEALAELGQVRAAARAAGISPQRVYRERQKCPEFARAWNEAMDRALDALEETLLDRAMNGVEKQVYYGGKSCGSVRQYSDALAMFLLRARRPETYGRAATGEAQAALPAAGDRDDPVALIEARLRKLAAASGPASGAEVDAASGTGG